MIMKYFNVSRRADSKHNSSSHKYKQSIYTGTAADTVGAVSSAQILKIVAVTFFLNTSYLL